MSRDVMDAFYPSDVETNFADGRRSDELELGSHYLAP